MNMNVMNKLTALEKTRDVEANDVTNTVKNINLGDRSRQPLNVSLKVNF